MHTHSTHNTHITRIYRYHIRTQWHSFDYTHVYKLYRFSNWNHKQCKCKTDATNLNRHNWITNTLFSAFSIFFHFSSLFSPFYFHNSIKVNSDSKTKQKKKHFRFATRLLFFRSSVHYVFAQNVRQKSRISRTEDSVWFIIDGAEMWVSLFSFHFALSFSFLWLHFWSMNFHLSISIDWILLICLFFS